MATHASVLAWRVPWTKQPGRLQSHRVPESYTTETIKHMHSWFGRLGRGAP